MISLDNKQLRWYRKDGKFELVSVDEAISRGLNKWEGWKCSAGVRALYIDYDGGVWVGNCASAAKDRYVDEEWEPYRIKKTEEKFGKPPYEEYINKQVEKKFGKFPYEEYVKQMIDDKVGEAYPHTKFHYKYGDHSGLLFEKLLNRVNREFAEEIKKYTEHIASNFAEEILKFQDDLFPSFLKSGLAYKNINLKKERDWGYLGDIYYKGFKYPKKWVTCPFNSCGCGSDVIISKFKTKDNLFSRNNEKLLKVTNEGYRGQSKTHDNFIDEVQNGVGIEMNFPIPYQILWDVSRRCNYDCSYCWPNVHNNIDNHFEKEVAFETSDKIIEWANGNEVRFNFGGGEPTLVPYFTEWMKYLKERNQWTMVTTNGSMSNSFWEECVKYLNSINMSAHFDSMASFPNRKERFLRNVEIIMDYHDKVDNDHWLEIKLMTPPKKLDKALNFKKQIEDLDRLHKPGANGRMKGVCSLVPIRSIEDSSELVEYKPEELNYFVKQ
jgi:organic radical activating enzyme